MRSFNFSRLARSTCCQRPFHLTPERGGAVGVDPMAHVLETPNTHLNGSCWETFQPYRESRGPSTRAPEVSRRESTLAPRGRRLRRAAVFRAHKAERQKPLIKDRLEVLRLTLNPSENSVPEYRPRGRGRFLTALVYQMSQVWQGTHLESEDRTELVTEIVPVARGKCAEQGARAGRCAERRSLHTSSDAGPITRQVDRRLKVEA